MRKRWNSRSPKKLDRFATCLLWIVIFLTPIGILAYSVEMLFAVGGICPAKDSIRDDIVSELSWRETHGLYRNNYVKLNDIVGDNAKIVLLTNAINNIEITEIFGEQLPLSYMGVPPCLPKRRWHRTIAVFRTDPPNNEKSLPSYFDPKTFLARGRAWGLPYAYQPVDAKLDEPSAYVVPQTHSLISLMPLPDQTSLVVGDELALMHRAYDFSENEIWLKPRRVDDVDWIDQLDDLVVYGDFDN